jgi:ABC-type branched-subunit amino acid transport system substrate-binding protein
LLSRIFRTAFITVSGDQRHGNGSPDRGGGVNGRKLRLITLDDGYEPTRTGPNIRRLIENVHILAIIGNVGTFTAIVAVPLVNKRG